MNLERALDDDMMTRVLHPDVVGMSVSSSQEP